MLWRVGSQKVRLWGDMRLWIRSYRQQQQCSNPTACTKMSNPKQAVGRRPLVWRIWELQRGLYGVVECATLSCNEYLEEICRRPQQKMHTHTQPSCTDALVPTCDRQHCGCSGKFREGIALPPWTCGYCWSIDRAKSLPKLDSTHEEIQWHTAAYNWTTWTPPPDQTFGWNHDQQLWIGTCSCATSCDSAAIFAANFAVEYWLMVSDFMLSGNCKLGPFWI